MSNLTDGRAEKLKPSGKRHNKMHKMLRACQALPVSIGVKPQSCAARGGNGGRVCPRMDAALLRNSEAAAGLPGSLAQHCCLPPACILCVNL
jgi:hypothetical protein